MTFRYQLLQIQTFECTVCHQHLSEENLRNTAQVAKLFGAKAYAVCPCCLQEVGRQMIRNRAYRKRARQWLIKNSNA